MGSNTQEPDFGAIESYLMKFGGGDILIDEKYWNQGIAVVKIQNPLKKNAISGKMMVDLRRCIERLEMWEEGKAVIFLGADGNFCSGGDLVFARQCGNYEGALNMSTMMMDTLSRLSNLDLISVCIVQGPTLGGGAELSVFCDYILATDDTRYGFVQGKMGIMTAWGGGTKLIQKIGHRKAMDLLLTSKLLNAEECVKLGIAEKVVNSTNCLEETLLWLNGYLIHHYRVIRSFKQLVNTSKEKDMYDTLKCERKLSCELWGGEENRKMLAMNIKHCKNEHSDD